MSSSLDCLCSLLNTVLRSEPHFSHQWFEWISDEWSLIVRHLLQIIKVQLHSLEISHLGQFTCWYFVIRHVCIFCEVLHLKQFTLSCIWFLNKIWPTGVSITIAEFWEYGPWPPNLWKAFTSVFDSCSSVTRCDVEWILCLKFELKMPKYS